MTHSLWIFFFLSGLRIRGGEETCGHRPEFHFEKSVHGFGDDVYIFKDFEQTIKPHI